MSYTLTTPCSNCPFRSDKPFPLPAARVREIEAAMDRTEFPCHKTTDFDDDGEVLPTDKTIHCAGALILLEKLGRPSQMMRIAERLGMYDRLNLSMDAPVYDSFSAMARACAKAHNTRAA